ncbi:cysteine proteinase [Cyathus striatus]|nr:cysteine proteinase [Cyathus striatus]
MNDSVVYRPLIGILEPLSELREEYSQGSSGFLGQIDWLIANEYDYIRRTKGDGDCFYRSLGFAYVESLLRSVDHDINVAQSLSSIEATKELLLNQGIESLVFEDPLDEFSGLIQSIVSPRAGERSVLNDERLLEAFQDALVSNTIVMYLRLLTSAQIRQNRESYAGFVPMDIDSFCANIVQPMGREADNVEMDALCHALKLNIDVVYLNGGRADSVDVIKFRNDPNANAKPLILLYRPGHYDILYKRA